MNPFKGMFDKFGWRNPNKIMMEIGREVDWVEQLKENTKQLHKEDLPMPKEKSLAQGIDLLQGLDLSNADGVTVNTFTYDDGSTSIEVGVSFPGPVEEADTAER